MLEHLTERQVESYRANRVSPEDLLLIDEHISVCNRCALLIRDSLRVRRTLELWQSDFDETTTNHISYEQQAAFVDGTDAIDREIVESHLSICPRCSEEMSDLLRFKPQFSAAEVATTEQVESEPVVVRGISGKPSDIRRPRRWLTLQLAAAAVAIIFLGWMLTWSLRSEREELKTRLAEVEQENQTLQKQYDETSAAIENLKSQIDVVQRTDVHEAGAEPNNQLAVTLNDGDGQIAVDQAGNLTGLKSLPPALQQIVKNSLMTGQIQTPPAVANLVGRTGALMGGSGDGIAFSLSSPVGTAIQTDRPVFRWGAIDGATSYSVAVYDSKFNEVATSPPTTGVTWSASAPLTRGQTYFWQVTAIKNGKEIRSPVPPAPEARFRVIEQSKLEELSQLKRSASNSHLAAGVIFVKEGLLEDAQIEFETLARANATSPVAQKLLINMKALRHAKR